MFFPSKALALLGLLAGDALAVPAATLKKRQSSVDTFISTESPIAYAGVLANIGDDGSKVAGAAAGIVVASPSKSEPDCTLYPALLCSLFFLSSSFHLYNASIKCCQIRQR